MYGEIHPSLEGDIERFKSQYSIFWIILYCTLLYFTVLCFIILYISVPYCTVVWIPFIVVFTVQCTVMPITALTRGWLMMGQNNQSTLFTRSSLHCLVIVSFTDGGYWTRGILFLYCYKTRELRQKINSAYMTNIGWNLEGSANLYLSKKKKKKEGRGSRMLK